MTMRSTIRWLDAQSEHQILQRVLPNCLTICDVKCDNYYKLIVCELPFSIVEHKPKLKVYKGTTLISEQLLPGIPSAIESFYIDDENPQIPVIGISIGATVLFYRNLKPYYKYNLPVLVSSDKEIAEIENNENNVKQKNKQATIITAMGTLKRNSTNDNVVQCLIIATEMGDIFVLDSQTISLLNQARISSIKATPTLISSTGQYDIDYRIVVSTREGYLYILRKNSQEGRQLVKMDQPAVGLAILPIEQTIIVVCMNSSLDCYSKKGKKLWSVNLPAPAMCMEPITLNHIGMTLVCVALHGGLVQFYSQTHLVDQFTISDTVSAMKFGRLGQEEHVLVLITIDGTLIIKILKRTAEFKIPTDDIDNYYNENPSSSGNLQIPKKSSIFLEQTARERDNAIEIYHNLQSELWRLRLTAARATVDIINSSESTISEYIGQAPIKLAAEVLGIGPVFRLLITIENMAVRKVATHLNILLHADNRHYQLVKPFAKLPMLVPGAPIKIDFMVKAVMNPIDKLPPSDLTTLNSIIRIFVYKTNQAKPLIAAVVTMPASEILDDSIY